MVTCCQMCGVLGCSELLVYCNKCRIYAQHRYCLDDIPSNKEIDVYWLCEQCKNASLGNQNFDEEITKDIPKFQDHKSKSSYGSSTVKYQHQQRHNATVVVSNLKLNAAAVSSGSVVSESKNSNPYGFHTNDALRMPSSGYAKGDNKRKARRLILNDEDKADEELQPDLLIPDICNKNTLQVKEPVLESSPREYWSRPSKSSLHEIKDMLPTASHVSADMQDLVCVEKSDVSRDRVKGALRIRCSSGSLQKQVENNMDAPVYGKDKNMRRKRRVILNDEDEADGELQPDHFGHDAFNKSTRQENEPVLEPSSSEYGKCSGKSSPHEIQDTQRIASDIPGHVETKHVFKDAHSSDGNGALRIHYSPALPRKQENIMGTPTLHSNDKNKTRRKLILSDEDKSDGETHYDHLIHDAGYKSTFQVTSNTNKRSRKLILDDEDEANEDAQSDRLKRDACYKSTLQRNEPILQSSTLEHVCESANPSTEEISNMPQVADNAISSKRDMEHVETSNARLASASLHTKSDKLYSSPARPIINHVWRGFFNICIEEYGPLRAHLSTRACEKVRKLAKLLPTALHIEKLSRLDAWPKSFKVSPPTDDNIALYFLPDDDARTKSMLDQLLDDMNNKDIVLKMVFNEAELLVFSSVILPEDYHRFQGKHFLWGAFRGRQVPIPAMPDNYISKTNGLTEERHKVRGSNQTEESFDDLSPGNSVGSVKEPFMSKCFKLFGMSVPVHSISTKFTSHQQDPMEKIEKKDVNGVITSQSLKLFGSDVRVPNVSCEKELSFQQPETTNEAEVCRDYFGLPPKQEVEHKHIESAKCHDGYFEVFPTEVEGDMLELFPVRGYNMPVSSRIDITSDLDLKLTA